MIDDAQPRSPDVDDKENDGDENFPAIFGMAKTNRSKPVPQKMLARYESILALTDAFCRDHLDDDYRNLAQRMAATFGRMADQPCQLGAAPHLGLRHRLCARPDQLSVGPVDTAVHDHG